MSRFLTPCLLVVALILSVAACSNEEPAATAAAPETPDTSQMASSPHPIPTEGAANIDLSGIAKAEGGQTVAEVFAARDQLEGKTVVVRGKVVKSNANIMDRNWLHVRGGSGEEGTNDLTVTTTGVLPEVGDTVVVTGALGLNKDFGMNYQYPVIVEDAQVTVEATAE